MKPKRFWLLGWDEHYPKGGTDQVEIKFDTIDELEDWNPVDYTFSDWVELLDLSTGMTYRRELDGGTTREQRAEIIDWIHSLPID
ncbi:P-loop NTPase family protein [Exiguobacterium flavidum]|uniref:hypothetical protein n=1 Tax=Exiguobacterium flavidum TaxID=2184695 RepID=UPI000DF79127|nr:hypothetical protein [Exiguobacterium flavidum]